MPGSSYCGNGLAPFLQSPIGECGGGVGEGKFSLFLPYAPSLPPLSAFPGDLSYFILPQAALG